MKNLNQLSKEVESFLKQSRRGYTRDQQIIDATLARDYVLALNSHYKKKPSKEIMDLMKSLTKIKQRIENKIKRPLRASEL
ncbi:MAG: hypothetical protein ACPGR7_00395 [Flavobacteriaceae bacterium]|nr:hypothetical protein [Flavobacteriaceae bacterium]